MQYIQVTELLAGDILINVGMVEEIAITPQFVRLVITRGHVLSCAFYWYHRSDKVYIESRAVRVIGSS